MKRPFRLVTRTMGVTFITVAVILSLVFVVLLVNARDQVRAFELEKLEAGERAFSRLEAQRQRDEAAALAGFAESPTLKAALDTFTAPQPPSAKAAEHELELRTALSWKSDVEYALEKLLGSMSPETLLRPVRLRRVGSRRWRRSCRALLGRAGALFAPGEQRRRERHAEQEFFAREERVHG